MDFATSTPGEDAVELIELRHVAGPGRRPEGPRLVAAGLATLVVLIALVGLPDADQAPSTAATANPTPDQASMVPVIFGTAAPATPLPWAWTEVQLSGYGRGSSVTNLWVLDGLFVAEIETDEGPDGGPFGPVTSVLLASRDGSRWSDDAFDLPTPGFSIAAGAIADGRLWLLGHIGGVSAPRWQLWSTADGSWVREEDPVGLVEGAATVIALEYQGACPGEIECRGEGWLAQVAATESAPDRLLTSEDGGTWEPVVPPDPEPLTVVGITFFRDRWIGAVTSGPSGIAAISSLDRVEWSSRAVSAGGTNAADIATGVAGVVIVGDESVQGDHRPRVWLSGDGEAWLQLSGEVFRGRGPARMDHVIATARGYLAMSSASGDAWFSSDGIYWRDLPAFDAGTGRAVQALAAADDVLVAGGRSPGGRPTLWSTSLDRQLNSP